MDNELGLAEAIEAVRSELRKAHHAGRSSDVRFSVGSVEVVLAVEVVKTGGGEAAVKVLSILSLGGKGEVSRGHTNTVKVVLNPTGIRGETFEVASARDDRPDAPDESGAALRSAEESAQSGGAGSIGAAGGRPGG